MTALILCSVGENSICDTVNLSFISSLDEVAHLTAMRSNMNIQCWFPICNYLFEYLPIDLYYFGSNKTFQKFSRENNSCFLDLIFIITI